MENIETGTPLALAGSLRKPLLWLVALLVVILGAAAAVLTIAARTNPNAPMGPVFLACLVGTLSLGLVAWSAFRAGVYIDRDQLVVHTGIGSKRVALASLRGRGLREVDIGREKQLRPLWRVWGTSLPGLSTGWFRLRNGEKAVCVLLDWKQVSYLRSEADNLSLLLSLRDPDLLRARLTR